MSKKYILGMDFTIQEALKSKHLLEKMLPDCAFGVVSVKKDSENCALYLELEENRVYTPNATE